jgi:hypothetical protein
VLKKIYRFFKYKKERERLFREIKIKRIEDKSICSEFDLACENLIVFFVPGANRYTGKESISGGVISLVSLCEETRKLKEIHGAETIMCVFPRDCLFLKHENFFNKTNIYRIEQLPDNFRNVKKMIVHLPELMVSSFADALLNNELRWLNRIENIHVNIINASILLMPKPSEVDSLSAIADSVTITAAHTKYCNKYFRDYYNKPLHKFSAWISPEQYVFQPYDQKKKLLVVSPDENQYRSAILEKIKHVQGLEVVVLKNFTYEKFKEIIAKAKWALTFGEGLDGYILEPIFSGAIGFAVYNEDFFTPDFKRMKGIYSSYENMAEEIVADLKAFDNPELHAKTQREQYQLCARHYNFTEYQENIKKFYLGAYTFK